MTDGSGPSEGENAMPMLNPPHPGRVVRQECLEPLGLTVTEGAKALGVTRRALNNLVNGKAAIAAEMAVRLAAAFGGGAEVVARDAVQLRPGPGEEAGGGDRGDGPARGAVGGGGVMETLRGTVRLRPTRIGFLVSPFDHASIRRVMRYCTCLWGGRFNPIIPVSPELPAAWKRDRRPRPSGLQLAQRYIRFFEPDVFVDATKGFSTQLGYGDDKVDMLHPRVVPISDFVSKEELARIEFLFGLNVFDIFRHLYIKEFQFARRNHSKFALLEEKGTHSSFFDAVCGQFPVDDELDYIKTGYVDTFAPLSMECTCESYSRLLADKISTPLRVTSYGLELETEGWQEPLAFVFDPDEGCDLIDFWNLRMTRQELVAVNVHWFQDMAETLRDFVRINYRPLPGNSNGVMIQPTIEFASSIKEEHARELIDKHLSGLEKGSLSVKFWYTPLWDVRTDDRIARPTRAKLTADTKDVELLIQGEPRSAWIETLAPKFAEHFGQEARWINVLTISNFNSDSDLALCFPPKRRLSDFPRLPSLRNVLVSREGIVLFQKYTKWRELIEWSTGRDAIIGWLESQDVTARPSDAGRTAEQLIRAPGGLRGVELFADETIIRKLDEMAARRQVRDTEDGVETREYPDRTAPVAEWKALLQRRANRDDIARHFGLTDFTDRNILRLGLEVRCSVCQKDNWYAIDELGLSLVCARCLGTFNFPQGDLNFRATPWYYRVVGPFSVPDYAAGGYATALALQLLAHGLGTQDAQITYATGLDLVVAGTKMEVDFVLWHQKGRLMGENHEPATLFGEAKSYAKEAFTEGELSKLRALATHFPGSFLVLACLKKGISSREKRLITRLAEWGRVPQDDGTPRAPVIVLTGNEIFYKWYLEDTWKEAGGRTGKLIGSRYNDLRDLWRLADLTQQIYLDLPPWRGWVREWYKAKLERKKAHVAERVGSGASRMRSS